MSTTAGRPPKGPPRAVTRCALRPRQRSERPRPPEGPKLEIDTAEGVQRSWVRGLLAARQSARLKQQERQLLRSKPREGALVVALPLGTAYLRSVGEEDTRGAVAACQQVAARTPLPRLRPAVGAEQRERRELRLAGAVPTPTATATRPRRSFRVCARALDTGSRLRFGRIAKRSSRRLRSRGQVVSSTARAASSSQPSFRCASCHNAIWSASTRQASSSATLGRSVNTPRRSGFRCMISLA